MLAELEPTKLSSKAFAEAETSDSSLVWSSQDNVVISSPNTAKDKECVKDDRMVNGRRFSKSLLRFFEKDRLNIEQNAQQECINGKNVSPKKRKNERKKAMKCANEKRDMTLHEEKSQTVDTFSMALKGRSVAVDSNLQPTEFLVSRKMKKQDIPKPAYTPKRQIRVSKETKSKKESKIMNSESKLVKFAMNNHEKIAGFLQNYKMDSNLRPKVTNKFLPGDLKACDPKLYKKVRIRTKVKSSETDALLSYLCQTFQKYVVGSENLDAMVQRNEDIFDFIVSAYEEDYRERHKQNCQV